MGGNMKEKKSVGEKVKEFLGEIFLGRWGRYDDYEDKDVEPEENDPRFRLKWEIRVDDEDTRG